MSISLQELDAQFSELLPEREALGRMSFSSRATTSRPMPSAPPPPPLRAEAEVRAEAVRAQAVSSRAPPSRSAVPDPLPHHVPGGDKTRTNRPQRHYDGNHDYDGGNNWHDGDPKGGSHDGYGDPKGVHDGNPKAARRPTPPDRPGYPPARQARNPHARKPGGLGPCA